MSRFRVRVGAPPPPLLRAAAAGRLIGSRAVADAETEGVETLALLWGVGAGCGLGSGLGLGVGVGMGVGLGLGWGCPDSPAPRRCSPT